MSPHGQPKAASSPSLDAEFLLILLLPRGVPGTSEMKTILQGPEGNLNMASFTFLSWKMHRTQSGQVTFLVSSSWLASVLSMSQHTFLQKL